MPLVNALERVRSTRGCVGVECLDGRYADTLEPGPWAFWKGDADVRVLEVDLRELTLDIQGQEIMSGDKVNVRINAVATYRVRRSAPGRVHGGRL